MSIQDLTTIIPVWTKVSPNTPEPVIACQCMLVRNLAGFVFPSHAGEEERRAVESRILHALNKAGEIPPGQYHTTAEMDATTMRVLAERQLIPVEFLAATGTRGVYIAGDQSLMAIVNMTDHLLIRKLDSSAAIESLWPSLDKLDSVLGGILDYAYHERLGFLTSSLRLVGTGLKIVVLLHLPALAMRHETTRLTALSEMKGLAVSGIKIGEPYSSNSSQSLVSPSGCLEAEVESVLSQSLYMDMLGSLYTDPVSTVGNLFTLTNGNTLGISEEECFFQMAQAVSSIVREEEMARERLLMEQRSTLMDSIGRALGIAQGARLLGMREMLTLASMMRLAAALGLLTGCSRETLNQALIECQQAHLQYMRSLPPDSRILAGERARMFRALFAGTVMN
jgi:protein arginine kinase